MKEQENGHLLLVALSTKESQMIDGGNVCGPMGPISNHVPHAREGVNYFFRILAWTSFPFLL